MDWKGSIPISEFFERHGAEIKAMWTRLVRKHMGGITDGDPLNILLLNILLLLPGGDDYHFACGRKLSEGFLSNPGWEDDLDGITEEDLKKRFADCMAQAGTPTDPHGDWINFDICRHVISTVRLRHGLGPVADDLWYVENAPSPLLALGVALHPVARTELERRLKG